MICVEAFPGKKMADQEFEIVERKGTGHPDTICDSVMDRISVALSEIYLKEFGTVLHHNIDKGLLAAGQADIRFGGGRVVRPMELVIGDRATFQARGKCLPVEEIALDAVKGWFREHLPHVDAGRDLQTKLVLGPGSAELSGLFSGSDRLRGANDTSAAVGFYPLTATEQTVLDLENFLNSKPFKISFPETGEDVKVMGMRRESALEVTVAMPLLADQVFSESDYFARKERIRQEIEGFLQQRGGFEAIRVGYNTLDGEGGGASGVYLSLLGTSAENADSGQVGRGNRVNGIIAVGRPLGTEAAAGKNPFSHVGKIYNVLAHKLAKRIYEQVEGLGEVYVFLLSAIGRRIDDPVLTGVRIVPERGVSMEKVRLKVAELCRWELARIDQLCHELARGRHPVC